MASALSRGLVGKTLLVATARGGAMVLLLLSVTLTFKNLEPDDFSLFNLAMFLISASSAICQPLNRAFWVSKSSAIQSLSYSTASSLTFFTVLLCMNAAVAIKGYSISVIIFASFSAAAYGFCRVAERYTYGKLLVAGFSGLSATPIILFSLIDFLVSVILLKTGVKDISLRLALPSLMFLFFMFLIIIVSRIPSFRFAFRSARQQIDFFRKEILSKTGMKFIILGLFLSLAAMIDRPIIYFKPMLGEQFSAAYLLALSYAVAMQTFLYLLFDMARAYVFQDGTWQSGAKRASTAIVLMAFMTAAGASLAYPILLWLGLLSGLIGWWLWTALLAKSMVIALSNILNVDYFQRGYVRQIVYSVGVMLLANLTMIALIYQGFEQSSAALVLLFISGITSLVMAVKFFSRAP